MKIQTYTLNFHENSATLSLVNREMFCSKIDNAFKMHSIVAILGPRQCGKTTLSKLYAQKRATKDVHFFDLEDPTDLARLATPKLALAPLKGLVVIDEIQRIPNLFPLLRVLVDEKPSRKFLILGSASRELIHQSSESLAGRIAYLELTPFTLSEIEDTRALWARGGFPKSFLARKTPDSYAWRKEYIRTYLEQDIPNLGFRIPPQTLHRFWQMLTHYHGQTLNYSEIGKSLGLSDMTIRHYIDILAGTFMIRVLRPWHENINKRQVKTPKIYFRDSGIFHTLLGVDSYKTLLQHPKLGASWEGFALEEVIRSLRINADDCYFWGIHNQAELDLLTLQNGKKYGFEIKFTDTPKITPSIQKSLEFLDLEKLTIICPGDLAFQLDRRVFVLGIERLQTK